MDISNLSLLMTATINPRNCSFVERKDPGLRLADYIASMRKWLSVPWIRNIIFCENSGSPLGQIAAVAELENRLSKNIRLVSYDSKGQGERGKGYGELDIIQHAVKLCGLRDSDCVFKITGRYHLKNVEQIVGNMAGESGDVLSCPFILPGWIASECFCSTVAFLRRFLFPKHNCIDDTPDFSFEHFLAQAVREASEAGVVHRVFRIHPELEGISGGTNVPWENTYMATAPIINHDGSITFRDAAHIDAVRQFAQSFLVLGRREASMDKLGCGVREILNSIDRRCEMRIPVVLTRDNLMTVVPAIRFCVAPENVDSVASLTGMNVRRLGRSLWCKGLIELVSGSAGFGSESGRSKGLLP